MVKYAHKKSLGQNFLSDTRVQQKIIESCDFNAQDHVIEIGPGMGALSALIAPKVGQLTCVEADRDLIEPLRLALPSHVAIVNADFLQWDIPQGVKVFGNIPYYISTPIIEKLIANRSKISEAFLTVQLEFGQRLIAKPGGKEYGSLTCFAQYYADIKLLFKIKSTSFKPAPKVDSCFISLHMKSVPQDNHVNEAYLFKLIQTAFQQRRKNIVNTLKGMVGKEKLESVLKDLNINPDARPENLSLSDYMHVSNLLECPYSPP